MICFKDRKFHFIGIGGVGVNALARYVLDSGGIVSGSDAKFSDLCTKIQNMGAQVYEGTNIYAIDKADYVVYSSAIKADHPELMRARELKIPIFERQEFLHEIANGYKNIIGIAGTHGKTTTTAMVAHILADCNKNFVAMIGGSSVDFGNYVNNSKVDNDIFLVEACEYKRNFLSLNPTVAVVTNVECDHPDCYQNYDSVKEAFDKYVEGADVQICLNSDNEKSWEVIVKKTDSSYVVGARLDKNLCHINSDGNVYNLSLIDGGDYNFKNATFAIAVAKALGIDAEQAVKSLGTFKGVARRFEHAGEIDGAPVYFDFAHHPTEISCVLKRAKKYGKILAIFQPHTYSRTKAYFDDFVKVFGTTNEIGALIFMPTYAAREKFDGENESDALAREIEKAFRKTEIYLAKDMQSTYDLVSQLAKSHDIVIFIGAGDIYDIKHEFFDKVDK